MTQPNHTDPILIHHDAIDQAEDATPALLVRTAQQAVLPRKLDEGVYAVLTADGAVQIVETPGYADRRVRDWTQENADSPADVHRQTIVYDVESLINYLYDHTGTIGNDEVESANAHGVGCLEMWADLDQRTIKAVIDGVNGWRQHTATLQLKLSREWTEWATIDGKLYDQVTFAEFIEGHLSTIAYPDGGQLLDVCQTLQVHNQASFKQSNQLATGQRVFRFEEDLETKAGTKGDLAVPTELTLALRPFQGGEPVPVTARFRFRLRDGVLQLGVKLAEPEKSLEDAFAQIVDEVSLSVPTHVHYGRG